jgi:hypothetical protein
MKTIVKLFALSAVAAALFNAPAATGRSAPAGANHEPLVQIAILLDTSSSMDGLIDQAKGQLWKIVNEFIKAKQNGRTPELQVALYEYGKSRLSPKSGWIRRIVPLSNDLDKISEELFALGTNGGQEYCGWVIKEAVENLAWNPSADVYKAIFIAGNEPFTQGPVNYAEACKAAVSKGIIVNTIHCGGEAEGVNGKWREGALLADGKYMFIDQNRAVVHFEAPQDQEIAQLGVELNRTYVAYGAAGLVAASRQMAQDQLAMQLSEQGAAVNRAVTKASRNYRNSDWDLVDAFKENKVKLAELKKEELPPEMQKMTLAEREAYMEAKAKGRAEIQEKIQQLNEARNKYIAKQTKQDTGTNTLDAVMIATLREQAGKRNFQFDQEKSALD